MILKKNKVATGLFSVETGGIYLLISFIDLFNSVDVDIICTFFLIILYF